MIKYAVHPGGVISRNDNDYHFIGAAQLMRLYRVRPEECMVVDHNRSHGRPLGIDPKTLIHLFPKPDGDYTLPEEA